MVSLCLLSVSTDNSDYLMLSEKTVIGDNAMAKKNQKVCCTPVEMGTNYCKVESVITVDERGQMVLPKELRDRANIRAGDKLAIISWDKGGEVCCIYLIKAEHLAERVKDFLGPMMKGVAAT
jgi:AbrB family looped-hinge helix DNA binding protein